MRSIDVPPPRFGGGRRPAPLLIVLACIVAIAGIRWALRPAPHQIAPPARSAPGPSTTVAAAGDLFVHVAGAVRRPGLYGLPAGSRVADAIEAAGGPVRGAALNALNLAEVLLDGVRIEVPVRGEGAEVVAPTTGSSPGAAATVSINSATELELEAIPGIGPVKAGAIVAYRTEAGGFTALEQLLEVSGIGPATLEAIRPHLRL